MLRTTTVLVLVTALLALPACQMNERLAGTVIGASSGALVGGLASSSVVGVFVGGIAGGVAGYLVGDYMADKRERCMDPCAPPCPPACPPPCPPTAQATVHYAPGPSARSAALVQEGRLAATTPEALRYYEEALRVDPRNAEAWNQIGLARVTAGDHHGGRAAFQQALAIDPQHRRARSNLAWAGGR